MNHSKEYIRGFIKRAQLFHDRPSNIQIGTEGLGAGILGATALPAALGYTTLYHGTKNKLIPKILQEGLKGEEAISSPGNIFLSRSKPMAATYAAFMSTLDQDKHFPSVANLGKKHFLDPSMYAKLLKHYALSTLNLQMPLNELKEHASLDSLHPDWAIKYNKDIPPEYISTLKNMLPRRLAQIRNLPKAIKVSPTRFGLGVAGLTGAGLLAKRTYDDIMSRNR